MKSFFSSDFFVGNRKRLRESFTGTAPIVISSNGALQRRGDNSYRFSQEPNFWYLTGINEPDMILVMDRNKEYLIIPGRSVSRQTFDGGLNKKDLRQVSGIKTILDSTAGWNELSARVKKVKHIATVGTPPAYVGHYGIYTNPARATMIEKLRQENKLLDIVDLSGHLCRLRMTKQVPELAAIQRAIDITTDSLTEAAKPAKRRNYKWEYEIEAELSKGFRSRGATGHAFDPIVAGGQGACTLHNVANDNRLAKNDWIVIDVGAEVENYCADITRTISLGRPNQRQQEIFQAVSDAQDFAMSLLKPGMSFRDYENRVSQFMGEKLMELGLIKKATPANLRKYCPHATSHFLGLSVHDIGDYHLPLEPGMVLTVEPGIYVPEEGIGVRIEDDVLITARGKKVLSQKLPRRF